jgi:hypothetical protein
MFLQISCGIYKDRGGTVTSLTSPAIAFSQLHLVINENR